jgi:hypothetical protein
VAALLPAARSDHDIEPDIPRLRLPEPDTTSDEIVGLIPVRERKRVLTPRAATHLLFARCATGRVAGDVDVVSDQPGALLSRGCESRVDGELIRAAERRIVCEIRTTGARRQATGSSRAGTPPADEARGRVGSEVAVAQPPGSSGLAGHAGRTCTPGARGVSGLRRGPGAGCPGASGCSVGRARGWLLEGRSKCYRLDREACVFWSVVDVA